MLYDKHTLVELDRLAEQRELAATRQQLAAANITVRPLMVRKLAGWVGSQLHTWGHQLETYSQNCPCPAPVN